MFLRRIHKVPLERSRQCFFPVFVSNFLRSVPHLYLSLSYSQFVQSLCFLVRFFSILSACFLVFFAVISNDISSCEVTALMPTPPRLVGSFILVQSSSSSDLSIFFSQMPFVFVPSVSATFASKSRAIAIDFGHEPQSLRSPRVQVQLCDRLDMSSEVRCLIQTLLGQ